MSSCKVPAVLVRCIETWIFSTEFRKKTQISNFTKIRSVGAELLMRTDGRTDGRAGGHDKASSRFSQFCERA
jgi:hypothetical protein